MSIVFNIKLKITSRDALFFILLFLNKKPAAYLLQPHINTFRSNSSGRE